MAKPNASMPAQHVMFKIESVVEVDLTPPPINKKMIDNKIDFGL